MPRTISPKVENGTARLFQPRPSGSSSAETLQTRHLEIINGMISRKPAHYGEYYQILEEKYKN